MPPEAADIARCLCMQAGLDALGRELGEQQRVFQSTRDEVARLDAQLQAERPRVDVNNPDSVSRYKQLVEQRDAAFRRSNTEVSGTLRTAVDRYDARVKEYNSFCANRLMDSVLVSRVQGTLNCPPM